MTGAHRLAGSRRDEYGRFLSCLIYLPRDRYMTQVRLRLERILASALSGDGLASCVYNFDHIDQKRPRAIILGTDNEVHGSGVYTIDEAATLAKERNVRVYGLNPLPYGANHTELSAATEKTGGRTWGLDQAGATDEVTSNIDELEAARLPDVAPVHVRTDLPTIWLSLGLLGLIGLYPLLWWWRR